MSSERPLRIEGYWWSANDPKYAAYPWPEARNKAWDGQLDLLAALKRLEEDDAQEEFYRGFSTCRLCGVGCGSSEFTLTDKRFTWRWPSGLIHYIDKHNVKPSKDFRNFVFETYERLHT